MAIATVFGKHADPRLAAGAREAGGVEREGGELPPIGPHDYCDQAPPFWMDYVSDTGDGWDATYTVAYHLAQDELVLRVGEREAERAEAIRTQRGHILVFGGDEVYPTASPKEYDLRLVLPYQHALPGPPSLGPLRDAPDVFAIPGNHDWYDSLVAFTRLFCSGQSFAGWNARQRQSYFALRLPMGWWLIATDLQLGSEIDRKQHAFFEKIEKSVRAPRRTRETGRPSRRSRPSQSPACSSVLRWAG